MRFFPEDALVDIFKKRWSKTMVSRGMPINYVKSLTDPVAVDLMKPLIPLMEDMLELEGCGRFSFPMISKCILNWANSVGVRVQGRTKT